MQIAGFAVRRSSMSTSTWQGVLVPALQALNWPDGSTGAGRRDILVISSKVVSKAEGQWWPTGIRPSPTTRYGWWHARPLRIVENHLGAGDGLGGWIA